MNNHPPTTLLFYLSLSYFLLAVGQETGPGRERHEGHEGVRQTRQEAEVVGRAEALYRSQSPRGRGLAGSFELQP